MRSPCLLLVLSLLFPTLVCLTSAQTGNYLYHICNEDNGNYTSNSTYQKNLNTLLSTLSSNKDFNYGFYNFSEGQGGDAVNSIALCRGDRSQSECQTCLQFATVDLPRRCPSQIEAIVWYEYCMFRYSNQMLFRSVGDISFYMWNANNVSDVGRFNLARDSLLTELEDRASSGGSLRKFAVGETNYTSNTTIYGLVQCTPDLTEVQCGNCLRDAARGIIQGKQGGRVLGPSCNIRFETYQFYEKGLDAPPPPPSSPVPVPPTRFTPPPGEGSNNVRNTILIVVSTVFIGILVACTFIFLRLRKQKTKFQSVDEIGSADALQLDLETIKAATNGFSNDNKLGQGGFGSVYKGKLIGGQLIAVKRLAAGSGQGDMEFKNEVVLVAKLQHRNLVRLLGFCLEGEERLLIYEFVPNASLDQFLFDPVKRPYLDWERRHKIIAGVARGLLYLHEDSRLRIIHRDLKASNILLDEEMHPKIADFGMARLFVMDQTQGSTSRVVGTYGYMAPEYAMHGQFSVKSDVYSFGVLLLELVSGQKNSCFRIGETVKDLISFAWGSWKAGNATAMIDPTIINGPRNEIIRCIHIGLLCVQESVIARPTMASVVLMLSSFSLSLPIPLEPAFFLHSSSEEPNRLMLTEYSSDRSSLSDSKGISSNYSRNDISVSEMYPR